MTIDIISFTSEQFASLNAEQILQIKEAQLKKNALDRKLQRDMQKEKHRLIDNGMYLSGIWDKYCNNLREVHAQEVEALRDGLLFYLQYSAKPEKEDVQDAPYTVDYALEMAERYAVVRDYYMGTYTDRTERINAFKADAVARQYLGELYATLYDYLLSQT